MARKVIFAGGAFSTIEDGAAFAGPVIETLLLAQNVVIFPRDYAARFSGPGLTFTLIGGPVPGLALSAAGVLTGTPTTIGTTAGLLIRATDGTTTVDSNAFSIQVVVSLPNNRPPPQFMANVGRMMLR